MGALTERIRDYALNLGLLAGLLAVVALSYAFYARWSGPDPSPIGRAPGDLGDIIQVDVRNGCGLSGLASRMTAYLREYGFDVVEEGNHTSFDVTESIVLDRVGNPRAAEALARAVGLDPSRVRDEIRQDYFLDATIVIGADYASIHPFSDDPSAVPCP